MHLVDPTYLKGKRVLMFMANFFAMHDMIISGLHDLGADVDFYDERPSNSVLTKALIRINPKIMQWRISRYYREIAESTRSRHYDYVFFIKGECVPVSILRLLRQYHPEAKFVLYEWDSVVYYQKQFDCIRPHFDKLVSFDRFDCEQFGMQFLPPFYDPAFARAAASELPDASSQSSAPGSQPDAKYDLLFVGTVHSDRYSLVRDISSQFADLGKSVYTYLFMQHRLMYLKAKYIDRAISDDADTVWRYKPLSLGQLAQLYRQSRIILEIPRPNLMSHPALS